MDTSNTQIHDCPDTSNTQIHDCPDTSNTQIHDCPDTSNTQIHDCPDTSNTQIHDCPIIWIGIGTSITNVWVNIVLLAQISYLSEMILPCNSFIITTNTDNTNPDNGYKIMELSLSVTFGRSAVFSGYAGFLIDRHNITEILLKVGLSTITLPHPILLSTCE